MLNTGCTVRNITRVSKDTYPDRFRLVSANTNAVIDVTGCTFKLVIDQSSSPANEDNSIVISGVVVDAGTAKVEFPFSAPQADMVGRYYYWAKITDSGGKVRTFSRGEYHFV